MIEGESPENEYANSHCPQNAKWDKKPDEEENTISRNNSDVQTIKKKNAHTNPKTYTIDKILKQIPL